MSLTATSFLEASTAFIRPIVTLILVIVLSWGFLKAMISPDAFLGIAGMAIGFWFRDREANKETAAVATQAAEKAVELTKEGKP
jgi:hypothetical protein